jgi:hypothetical protein
MQDLDRITCDAIEDAVGVAGKRHHPDVAAELDRGCNSGPGAQAGNGFVNVSKQWLNGCRAFRG